MYVNHSWTLLSRGTTSQYGREVSLLGFTENPVSESLHAKMVPNPDSVFASLATEQIIQAIRESSLSSQLYELDPLNTYSHPILNLMQNSYSVTPISGLETHVLNENTGRTRWCSKSFSVRVDPGAMQAIVSSSGVPAKTVNYTIAGGLTSKIPLTSDVMLRMGGTIPGSPFVLSVAYLQKFNRTMNDILEDISSEEIYWVDNATLSLYFSSRNPVDRVAAVGMNLYRKLRDVNKY